MLKKARKNAKKAELNNIQFTRGDIYNLPFKERKFDLITVSNAPFSLREIKKVLTKEGYLLISLSLFGKGLKKKEKILKRKLSHYGYEIKKIESFAEGGSYILMSFTD